MRRWLQIVSSIILSSTLVSAAIAQESTGHTLFGNWFGKRDTQQQPQQQQQDDRYNQRGNVRQASDMGDVTPQQSQSRSQMNQLPPDPSNGTELLPGLGGSPLPKKSVQQGIKTVPAKPGTTPSNTPKTTQQSSGQRMNAAASSARRSPSRPNAATTSNGALTSTPGLGPATSSNTSAAPAATRQSPSRRTVPHINSNDFKNELSGSFPNPVDTGEPVARTARVDEHRTTTNGEMISDKPTAANSGVISQPAQQNAEKSAATFQPAAQPMNEARPTEKFESDPRSAAEAFSAKTESRSNSAASRFVRTPYSSPATGPQAARGKEAFGEALSAASGGDPNVLASNQAPILNADIRGPKQIMIGREAVYRVHLQNQSDVPAEGITATVRIPAGADVVNATATQGIVQQPQDAQSKGQMQWQIGKLDRRAGETLEVHLIPRESRPLDLGVTWTVAPVGSHAVVEVQEPKLQLEVQGPSEVFFDRPQVFKLTITNPGTGPAENVKIELLPPGGKEGAKETVTSHPLGDLPAGGSQSVEVELTAREAGKMFVKASATAEGGLSSNASKEVFCRKPELEVDWRGPATKYAGTLATYFVRVRNPGTAPAEDVTVKASLPEGAEFTSASEGQSYDAKSREVSWHVGTLRPGDDNYMELKCVLKSAGANQLKISAATAAGNLIDTKTAATNVIALADLKLEVIDPSGPVAVNTTTIYEIHIKNRGSNSAKDVTVVGLFSEGIEPEQAEGATYTVADGRVSFKTIENVTAGQDIVLRIRAHAVQPGTHIFRAEVLCRDLEIKLAAEETTRFYADDAAADGSKTEKQAGRSDAFKSSVR